MGYKLTIKSIRPHLLQMPTIKALPDFSQKSLQRRRARLDMTQTLIAVIEPARLATDLRQQRRTLHRRLAIEIERGESVAVAQISGAYCRVAELLMRICRIPQAPPGAKANGKVTLPLDLSPDPVDAPEIAPSEQQDGEQQAAAAPVPT